MVQRQRTEIRFARHNSAHVQAPDELVCPITHALFRSPVVTAAGTVYEERAIAQHLATTSKDPLTNQPLHDHKLTPVFLLRSRAEQYAVSTASACVQRTLQADCPNPARYLRRACELCDEAGAPPYRSHCVSPSTGAMRGLCAIGRR